MSYVVVVDTREQKPYKFNNFIVKKLDIGDYSIEGYEDIIAIERKTLADWISSVTKNRKQMEEKIIIAKEKLSYYTIVIESDLPKMWKKSRYSKVAPVAYINTAIKWSVKYNLPIFFSSTASQGNYLTKNLLQGFYYYQLTKKGLPVKEVKK